MARKKQPEPETQPADVPRLRNHDELEAAERDARARKAAALQKLAADGRHPTAVRELHKATAELREIADERAALREIERLRAEAQQSEAERAARAAAAEAAAAIPSRITAQGSAFAELLEALRSVADSVEAIEAEQRNIAATIRRLPGREHSLVQAANASRTARVALIPELRETLKRLKDTRLLEPWVSVNALPREPDRNPSVPGESHDEARRRVAALPRDPIGVFRETADKVRYLLQFALDAELPPQPSDALPGQAPGATRPHGSQPSSADILAADDRPARAARHAQRVANAAKPITRDGDGKIAPADPAAAVAAESEGAE